MIKLSDNFPRCLSPALFNNIFAQWPKEKENFAKFQTKVSPNCFCGHVKRKFDILARIFIQGAESFFLCPNMSKEKICYLFRKFFASGSSRQVESSFVKPTEKNWANDQVFSSHFLKMWTISFLSMKKSCLKMPFGTVRHLFWQPTGLASRKTQNFLAQA